MVMMKTREKEERRVLRDVVGRSIEAVGGLVALGLKLGGEEVEARRLDDDDEWMARPRCLWLLVGAGNGAGSWRSACLSKCKENGGNVRKGTVKL